MERKVKTGSTNETFTSREIEILNLMAEGLSNQAIAEGLFLSLETVKWYNKHLFRKLRVSNRTQAIAKARQIELAEFFSQPVPQPQNTLKHNLPSPLSLFIGRKEE